MMTKLTLSLLAGTGILVLGAGGVWCTLHTVHPVAPTVLHVPPWGSGFSGTVSQPHFPRTKC